MVDARPSRRTSRPPAAAREEIDDLLSSVEQLRLTLAADLSAAAGALDAGDAAVARDIVAADRVELHRLRGDHVPPHHTPRRSRRFLLALPAIPLVGALAITTAAALAPHDHRQRAPGAAQSIRAASHSTPPQSRQTAASTLRSLERLVTLDPHSGQIVAMATHLHQQLSEIVEASRDDPTSITEVRRLLSIEQRVLESHRGDAVAAALAASRQLTQALTRALAPAGVTTPTLPLPVSPSASSTTNAATPTASPTPRRTVATSSGQQTTPTSTPTHSRPRHERRHHHHPFRQLLGAELSDGML
jgi:hypothetical protein